MRYKKIKKGDLLHQQNNSCRNLYFITSGLIKMYCYVDGKEFIMYFFKEGNMFTVLDSFPYQSPSKYNLLALEDTTVESLSHDTIELLAKKHHSFETFYRKLLLKATDNMMQRIRELLTVSHADHYNQFLTSNKDLVQRLSLGDLACYLGITQVSLSRIRSKK